MKKIYLLLIVLLFCSLLVFGVVNTVNSFYSKNNPFNVTFTGNQNYTEYISIPLGVYVNNITFTVQGLEP